MPTEPREAIKNEILEAGHFFANDLAALPETELTRDRGFRLPIDVAYEVVLINRRISARLREVEPDPLPDGEWIVAPETFRVKELAIDEVRSSTRELAEAWDALGEEALTKEVATSGGMESALSLAVFAAKHIAHHDGQLTMTQWIAGDRKNHWGD